MRYVKPKFQVTEFQVNEAVAGCDRVVIGSQTEKVYDMQDVHCVIGNQPENVFNSASGCETSSSQWGVTEYNGTMYFVWYTYAGDIGSGGAPGKDVTATLDALVKQLGFSPGAGWHYCKVTSRDQVTDILDFSY